MERLTVRNSEGIGVLKQPYQCERCGDLQWSLPDLGNGSPTDRLAEYEDLEEQGKLLKLPCKVGDVVWELCKCDDGIYKIFPMEVTKVIPYGSVRRAEGKEPTVWNIYAISADTDMYKNFYDFGKTVFPTQEEAETVLMNMEETNKSETYNIFDEEQMNEKISMTECRKLREVVNTLTCAPLITKREYVRLFTVINAIANRMEREGKDE